jgi:hypothetical protein
MKEVTRSLGKIEEGNPQAAARLPALRRPSAAIPHAQAA